MLDPRFVDDLDAQLAPVDAERRLRYPGPPTGRQPVHTVYVPGDRLTAGTVPEWGAAALAVLADSGPLPGFADDVHDLVRRKLADEPIEDLRIDFEDGYGTRPDDVEDADVRAAARTLAAAVREGSAPAAVGVRMKCLEDTYRRRGIRSLDLFLDELLGAVALPTGFRITLPKVTAVEQVDAMVRICTALEEAYDLPPIPLELQVETPHAILGADGTALIARMVHTAADRCLGLHYGTYDYSAALGIAAAHQSMDHPAADHAKAVMQVAAAQTGVAVSDGSTNVLPVGDRAAVHAAWSLHARLVRRSLERGFYQGWDLHPAQLPTRFAATFAFYRDGATAAGERLRRWQERAAGGILDEPATVRALASFLLRGVRAGALTDEDARSLAGVTTAELIEMSR